MLSYKTFLHKIKIIEIIKRYNFSDHKEIKLKISNRKVVGKSPNIWRFNNTLVLFNTWGKEEVSRKILKYFEVNENKSTTY